MKIVVLVKEVPDTYGDRRLSLETGLADRAAGEVVLDEIGERALELALTHADANPGTEVVALSMAPAGSAATVRKALAMGADSAVHVADEALLGADLGLTAEVLAAALRRLEPDLIITGNLSTDGSGGVIPAMLAELLDLPGATGLSSVTITDEGISGERSSGGATQHVSVGMPALISITEGLPDPRFPNFKGILASKKKPFETLSLEELEIDPDDTGAARSIIIAISERPARAAGIKIVDEGDAGQKLADFLVKNRLA